MSRGVGLTRERVLAAALDVIDADGPDALTMRRLGQECGVEAMSLYRHVSNKADVLAGVRSGVYDEVLCRLDARRDRSVRETMRGYAEALTDVLLAHPQLASIVLTAAADASELRVNDVLARQFHEAGHRPEQAMAAIQLVTSFVIGTTAMAAIPGGPWERPTVDGVLPSGTDAELDGLAWLREGDPKGTDSRQTLRQLYETGLTTILDGLELRLRAPG